MDIPFKHRFRVRYAEVDAQGVVFNSRYLEYADLLVTEFFRKLGLNFSGDRSLEFHVVRSEVNYYHPITLDEEIEGRIWVKEIGTSSLTIGATLHGVEDEDDEGPRTAIELVQVHVDLKTGKAQELPGTTRTILQVAQIDGKNDKGGNDGGENKSND